MSINDWLGPLYMSDLHNLITEKFKEDPKLEIFSIELDGKKVWVKKARKTGSNSFHKLMYKLTKNPLLVPVQNKSPKDALLHEAEKLEKLRQLDIPVPKIIDKKEAYFIMEDCGPTVGHLFYHEQIKNPKHVCKSVMIQLATLHKQGEFHGGSQLRNFAYNNDDIYFIDFEESFDKSINIEELQFRDLFLLLFSLQKMRIPIDLVELIELYGQMTDKTDTMQRLHTLKKKVSFLMKIIENKYIWKVLDNDSKSVYNLFKVLEPHFPS